MPNYEALKFAYGRDLAFIEKVFNTSGKLFKKYCPKLHKFCFSLPSEYKKAKSIICFLLGSIYASIVYYMTVAQIDALNVIIKAIIGGLLVLLMSLGMAMFYQMRCIFTLSLFNFMSASGRIILAGFIIGYMVLQGGPIKVGLANTRELTTSMMCYQFVVRNMTQDSYRLKWKPYRDIIVGLLTNKGTARQSSKALKSSIDNMESEMNPEFIRDVMENPGEQGGTTEARTDYSFVEEDERQKPAGTHTNDKLDAINKMRCKGIAESGEEICKRYLKKMETKCYDKVKVVSIICRMFSIDSFCSIGKTYKKNDSYTKDKYCSENLKDSSNPSAQEDASMLNKLRNTFHSKFDAKLTYDNKAHSGEAHKLRNFAADLKFYSEDMQREFDLYSNYMSIFFTIAKVLSSYGFLLIFIRAFKYNVQYLKTIEHDNFYITQYFRHIDARRYSAGKSTLLPLKKLEKISLVYTHQLKILPGHSRMLKYEFMFYTCVFILSVALVVGNFAIVEFIHLINKHGRRTGSQRGFRKILFSIQGTGLVARLLRTVLKDINIDETANFEYDTLECLPKAHEIERKETIKFAILYGILVLSFILEIYFIRFKRVICAFFYRKWEKQRILWLYNKTLKNRKLYMLNLIKRAILRSKGFEIEPDFSLLGAIIDFLKQFRRFKPFVRVLKVLKIGLLKCIICDETERVGSVKCDICQCLYCYECWNDVHKTCLVCTPSVYEKPEWRYEDDLKFS